MTNYIPHPMNSRFIIQLFVIIASLILGMLIYPYLIKMYSRFVTNLYKNLGKYRYFTEETEEEIKKKPSTKTENVPSVIGTSKTIIGHSRTKTSISIENEKVIEKENTFAPETDEESNLMNVDVPLGKVENLSQEEFDADEETVDLEMEKDAVLASGASYDELMKTGKVITKDKPTDEEKDEAGRILYENKSTEIVEQAVSNDEKTFAKVNALIHFHMKKHHADMDNEEYSGSKDFENFDVTQLF